MTDTDLAVQQHYEPGGGEESLASKITPLLQGLPDGKLTTTQLSGLDQFHVRGLAATMELAQLSGVENSTTVLDAGSGIGGPSRTLAETYGCHVTGIDLAPSYVEIANLLAECTGLDSRLTYRQGNLLSLDFPDEHFDLVWTLHVVMNIRDRDRLYRELARVLKPSGQLAFYDAVAAYGSPDVYYPVPWAETGETSFLHTKAETIAFLERAGFSVSTWKDVTPEAIAWFGEQRQPPVRGLSLATLMGPRFAGMTANLARNLREGRIHLAMGLCDKTSLNV